jgi:hypothetical protein
MQRYINYIKRFIKRRILMQGNMPSHMVSEKSIRLLQMEAANIISDFFKNIDIDNTNQQLINIVKDFFHIYPKRPIKNNIGGSGFENLFWLYISGRVLKPNLIIESGIWAGQSTWILRSACPEAEIHAFDIDLSNREYIDESVNYHKCDWSNLDLGNTNNNNSLCFFDDHVSHLKRILEAQERGFKNLIFDDNLPSYMLFRETSTITPTVDMIYDDELNDGDIIEWIKSGVGYSCVIDVKLNLSTRGKIQAYSNFPLIDYTAESAATKARLGGNSKTAFVRLH